MNTERSSNAHRLLLSAISIVLLSATLIFSGCTYTVTQNNLADSLTTEDTIPTENTVPTESSDVNNIIEDLPDSTRYEIADLNGSISVPNNYYVFSEDISYTDEMCRDISVEPGNMASAIPLLQGQTLIVPAGEPYTTSKPHIYVKVKAKKYDNITLSQLSYGEYRDLASSIVSSFGTSTYNTVEGNGLRFFVFTANQGTGNVCRYATILNGHMIYVYANGESGYFTEEQLAVIEYVALSIQHNL